MLRVYNNILEEKAGKVFGYVKDELDQVETEDELQDMVSEMVDTECVRLDCSGEAYDVARHVDNADPGLYEGETDIDRIILAVCFDGLMQEVWGMIQEDPDFEHLQ